MSQSEYLASLLKLIIQTKQIALNYASRILLNSASAIQPFSGVKSTQNKSFRLDNLTRAPNPETRSRMCLSGSWHMGHSQHAQHSGTDG